MDKNKNLSVIMPAYNEEETIIDTIDGIIKVIKHLDIQYELIVVDDGSTDKTARIIEDREVKVITHGENRGYGASLKTGIKNALNENILIIDADGTYSPEYIPVLLEFSGDYDMVVGARSGKEVNIPLIRRPAKWILNKLANYLTETEIPDLNSGIRIMKKSIIKDFIRILPNGFSFTTTITLAMLGEGYLIKFVPISYNARKGRSKIRPIHDTLNFLQLIIRTVMYFNPLRVFLPLALLFFLSGIVFLVRDVLKGNIAQSSIFLLISGTIVLSIGMLADLIDKRLR